MNTWACFIWKHFGLSIKNHSGVCCFCSWEDLNLSRIEVSEWNGWGSNDCNFANGFCAPSSESVLFSKAERREAWLEVNKGPGRLAQILQVTTSALPTPGPFPISSRTCTDIGNGNKHKVNPAHSVPFTSWSGRGDVFVYVTNSPEWVEFATSYEIQSISSHSSKATGYPLRSQEARVRTR